MTIEQAKGGTMFVSMNSLFTVPYIYMALTLCTAAKLYTLIYYIQILTFSMPMHVRYKYQ